MTWLPLTIPIIIGTQKTQNVMSSLHTFYWLHTRFDPDASGPKFDALVEKTYYT